METKDAILIVLKQSGPATMRELCDALAHRGEFDPGPPRPREHVCQELYGLIRANLVAVDLGIYSAVPA